jgi:hypothetical protein
MAAGYSGTPLAKKLVIKEGHVLVLLDAPVGWAVPDLPEAVEVRPDLRKAPDTTIAFVRSQADLARVSPRLVKATGPTAGLWIAWPRKAGGHVSDMTEQSLRDTFLPTGLVDVKVAAIDDDWSGLRFVWRTDRR